MNTSEKKKTIEERRAELEANYQKQLAELDLISELDNIIQEMIRKCQERIDDCSMRTVCVGQETEQAKNYLGELLYEVESTPWKTFTEKELADLADDVRATAKPYYRNIYKNELIPDAELFDWRRTEIDANKAVIKLLKELEY